jgi:hypothetical protein
MSRAKLPEKTIRVLIMYLKAMDYACAMIQNKPDPPSLAGYEIINPRQLARVF